MAQVASNERYEKLDLKRGQITAELTATERSAVFRFALVRGAGRQSPPAQAGSRMDKRPLQVVLRGNLIELLLDESNVFINAFLRPVDIISLDGGTGGDRAINGHADIEVIFVSTLERGNVGGPGRCPDGKEYRREQDCKGSVV